MVPVIQLKKVSKRFGKFVVLNEMDLEVFPGETLVIIGRSGVGKSTILKHISGLMTPIRGKCGWKARKLNAWPKTSSTKCGRKWEWCSRERPCSIH